MADQPEKSRATDEELEAMIAATDTGARSPAGMVGKLIVITAFSWSLFQLWIASPLPYLEVFSSWVMGFPMESLRLLSASGYIAQILSKKTFPGYLEWRFWRRSIFSIMHVLRGVHTCVMCHDTVDCASYQVVG